MGESEIRYSLTQEDLNRVAAVAGREAVAVYKAELKKMETRRADEKVSVTKKKLTSYRRVKASLTETEEFTEDEKIEYRWKFIEDLMGPARDLLKAEDTIISLEKKRKRDYFEIQSIDRAMELYRAEAERSDKEEFKRRYRIVMARHIDDDEKTIEEIAAQEGIVEKTVYKELGKAYKIVATYLLGM